MAYVLQSTCLTWINCLNGLRPEDSNIRTAIRRQAMSKAAAERKRRSKWTKRRINRKPIYQDVYKEKEQPLVNSTPHHDSSGPLNYTIETFDLNGPMVHSRGDSQLATAESYWSQDTSSVRWFPPSPSSTGFEAVRIRFDFDPVSLSGLTSIHVGRATARTLHVRPDSLLCILRCRKWSYLEYLPSRFGQTTCLDDAICCIAARVRQWMSAPAEPNRLALKLYSKAVHSLQVALNDPVLCRHPNVLCATEIMSIFELLDSGQDLMPTHHTTGVAALIEFRGSQGYQTDFEKSLFLAQWGPIYTEAMHQDNAHCFLEEPAWQATVQSIILEKSASIPYAGAFVSAWACMSRLPSLCRSIRAVVCDPHETSTAIRGPLLSRAYDLRSQLMDAGSKNGLTSTKSYGNQTYSFFTSDKTEGTKRYEILGGIAVNLMKVERYIVALDSKVAVPMEGHAQQLALQILDLERTASEHCPRAALFLACRALTAKAVLLTASDWRHDAFSRGTDSLISKPVFERWLKLCSPQRVMDEWKSKYDEVSHLFVPQDSWGEEPVGFSGTKGNTVKVCSLD
ncbi:MAG: hypothetical protein Q9213_004662 [Squamulea squamosa]